MTDIVATMAQVVPEAKTGFITGQFEKEDNSPVTLLELDNATLLLLDEASSDVLNDRNEQDVLNANGCVISADGTFSLRLDPEDNIIVNDRVTLEWHVARISFDYPGAGGQVYGCSIARFAVRNLVRIL